MNKVVGLFLEIYEIMRAKWAPVAARYHVDLSARFLGRNQDFTAKIIDISESGCFASVNHKLEIGSLVGIDFRYHNLEVHAVAIVVRNTKAPLGCGFMFVASTKNERAAIRNLIRKLEQDSAQSVARQAA